MTTTLTKVLFIGSSQSVFDQIRNFLDETGDYVLAQCAATELTDKCFYPTPPDSILIDGVSLSTDHIHRLLKNRPEVPIIILDSQQNETLAIELLHAGAQDYLAIEHITPFVLRRAINFAIERKKTAQTLSLQAAALNTAANAIVITDVVGTIVWANPAFTRLTGYNQLEVVGQNPRFLKSYKHPKSFYTNLWQTILAGQVWQGEMINRRKDGSFYTEDQTITPVLNTAGEITHFIAIKQDITNRRQIEDELNRERLSLAQRVNERTVELRAVNARLSHALKVKQEFLATMSHELRTPLNAILGMAEILHEGLYGELNSKQIKSLGLIEKSGYHLLNLINDILDLSQIEAGQMVLNIAEIPIERACQVSIAQVTDSIRAKNLNFIYNCHPSLSTITADEQRLIQILLNLLSNAVKFTPAGGTLGLSVIPSPQAGAIDFLVWDTGIGIAAENLPLLGQPFEQLQSGLNREYEGTGLGLSLVRLLTAMHRGTLSIKSQIGEGSQFTVSLPQTST